MTASYSASRKTFATPSKTVLHFLSLQSCPSYCYTKAPTCSKAPNRCSECTPRPAQEFVNPHWGWSMAHIVCMTCSRRTLICVLRYGVAVIQPKPFELWASPETPSLETSLDFWRSPLGNRNPSALDHPRHIDSFDYRINSNNDPVFSNSDDLSRGGKLSLLGKNLTGVSRPVMWRVSKTDVAGRTIDRTRGGPDSEFLQS